MKSDNVTLKMVKELIKEIKGQQRENKTEMRYYLRGLTRESFAEAAHLDSVNDTFDYILEQLETIVTHSK